MILSAALKKSRASFCALAVALGFAAPCASAQDTLPAELSGLSFTNAAPARIHVAQSQDSAQVLVRMQQLEEQVRVLNGQIEGLTFQMTQMQTAIEQLQSGRASAAPATSSSEEADVAPTEIPEGGVRPLPGEVEFDPTFSDGTVPSGDLGRSSDPLAGTGLRGGVDLATGQPLDLSYDPSAQTGGDDDADAQFAAGYEALVGGDFEFAEEQFTQFIELYPDNPQVTDAANWLGDALIHRAAYNEAAAVLLDAYQKSPQSPRAPDLLLKLGMSLAGAGEREVACRTYGQIEGRYTVMTPAFVTRLNEEKSKAECPPA